MGQKLNDNKTRTLKGGREHIDFTDEIIVIDDDRDDREALGFFFKRVQPDQNVHFFKNGDEFVSHVECQDVFWHDNVQIGLPRMILVDMHMPLKDGVETIKDIRSRALWHDVPIILITGTDDDEKINLAREFGANAFLPKPFDRVDLLQAIYRGFNYALPLV